MREVPAQSVPLPEQRHRSGGRSGLIWTIQSLTEVHRPLFLAQLGHLDTQTGIFEHNLRFLLQFLVRLHTLLAV
jgi:hypothetical protein